MTRFDLSVRLTSLYSVFFGIGVLSGGIEYAHRSPTRQHHSSGTSAWTIHLVLTATLVVGFLAWRRWRPGRPLFTAPFGRIAEHRIRDAGTIRLSLATLPALMLLYCWWRAGEQVLAGLDPNFTTNAWGGPSYLGAMYCHYLDSLLIGIAAAGLVHLALPGPDRGPGRSAQKPGSVQEVGQDRQ